jgi:phenylacetic acid degradation operon negative regulatory protein
MCRSGLLQAKRTNRKSYYSLTGDGQSLLTKGAQRIFQRKKSRWDGNWNIVTYSVPERLREARDSLRVELGWLGYGALVEATWISPYDLTREVTNLVHRLNIEEYVHIFNAQHQGQTDPKEIVSHCWELDKIHQKYTDFLNEYRPKLGEHLRRLKGGETIESSECFVERFNLIHEYRKLPYYDPDLPLELLPENWLRLQAVALFDKYHDSLTEKANEYFDSVSENYQVSHRLKQKGLKTPIKDLVKTGTHPPVFSGDGSLRDSTVKYQ